MELEKEQAQAQEQEQKQKKEQKQEHHQTQRNKTAGVEKGSIGHGFFGAIAVLCSLN